MPKDCAIVFDGNNGLDFASDHFGLICRLELLPLSSDLVYLELLAGIAKRKAFFQEVAQERHAEEVGGGALIVSARRFFANLRPIFGGIVIAAEPGKRDKIDLLSSDSELISEVISSTTGSSA